MKLPTVTAAASAESFVSPEPTAAVSRKEMRLATVMVVCALLSPAVYIAADVIAASRYPGYSYTNQAVSELFAIGAPTSTFVVWMFSISSALLLVFAITLWRLVAGNRRRRILAVLFALSAVNSLLLWTLFPMHMRGTETSLTDTMHLILAANPYWLLSLIFGALAFRDWFRAYSIAMIVVLLLLAAYGFSYAPAVAANGPTPGMGLAERCAQYLDGVWQAVLGLVVWHEYRSRTTRQNA